MPQLPQLLQLQEQLFEAWKECNNTTEREKTKRLAIDAWKDKELARIGGATQILREYLQQEFAQRKDVYQRFFDGMERALAEGNNDLAAKMADQIIGVIRQSPLDKARDILKLINGSNPLQLCVDADEDELEL